MRAFILILGMALSSVANGWRLLEPDSLDMEVWGTGYLHDPYMPQYSTNGEEPWRGGAAVNFNISLIEYSPDWKIYWNNRVHMDGTVPQVRHVGWWWDFGVSLGPKIDLFYNHHSRHAMEANVDARFPLRDVYGVRFKLFRRDN